MWSRKHVEEVVGYNLRSSKEITGTFLAGKPDPTPITVLTLISGEETLLPDEPNVTPKPALKTAPLSWDHLPSLFLSFSSCQTASTNYI